MHIMEKCLVVGLDEVEVQLYVLYCFVNASTQKEPNRSGSKFQEMPILVTNLDVSKRPYPCHALGRSVCFSQGCGVVSRTEPSLLTPCHLFNLALHSLPPTANSF